MKRAQLQSMETILISIVLILILLFSIYFFSQISNNTLQETREKFRSDEVLSAAVQLSSFPELSCSSRGETKVCIDKIKLDILSTTLNDPTSILLYDDQVRLRYVELFGNALITVNIAGPPLETIVLFNATGADNLLTQSFPINVYDAITNSMAFAIITVGLE